MSPLGTAMAAASVVLAVATLAGLIARRKLGACALFPVYLAAVAANHTLNVLWPDVFWTWGFWATTDVVHTGLRLGIAFEVAWRSFHPLPQGHHNLRASFALVTLLTAVAVLLYPRQHGDAIEVSLVVGRVSYGVALLFAVFLMLVSYYGVPIDPLHRVIAAGFAVASALLAFANAFSIDDAWGHYLLSKTAYPFVLAVWAVAAWRHDSLAGLSPRAVAILWPWRVR